MNYINKFISKVLRSLLWRYVPETRELLLENGIFQKIKLKTSIETDSVLFPPYNVSSSKIGKNVYIRRNSFLSHVDIGSYTYISSESFISNAVVGKFCSIGRRFICGGGIHPLNGLSTHPMFYSTKKKNGITLCKEDKVQEIKTTKIGNDVFIGSNVTILDGVCIGDGVVIGAGAIIHKDIPPYAIVVGSSKIVRYRFSDEIIQKLLQLEWWSFDEERLEEIEHNFFSVEEYLRKNGM